MDRVVKPATNRVFGLDLMRSLAMLSVILAHSGMEALFGLRHGIVAVESFFVMSGFLIGEMLIRDFRGGFDLTELKNFWVKRWFRTLPLYYSVLILKFIFIDHSIGANIIYYFLFLQNNFYGINFLTVSWTLVLEEWFYIIMPLLIYLFFRKGINGKQFFAFVITFVVLSNIARLAWVLYTDRPYGAIVGNFPFRLDSFLIGVGLAAVKIFQPSAYRTMGKGGFFLFACIALGVLLWFFRNDNGGYLGEQDLLWVRTVWFSLISVAIALLIPFICESPVVLWIANIRWANFMFTWISFLSYPIYLVHLDIFRLVDKLVPASITWHPAASIGFRMVFILILSIVLYKCVHEPFIALRTKLLSKRKERAQTKEPQTGI